MTSKPVAADFIVDTSTHPLEPPFLLLPQNGGECLRAYVSASLEQIAQWRDEQGNSGLWYVMQVVNQLLDPRTSEFTAAFVGRLVSTLISRAGTELGEQLDQILRAILSKMQQAETLSVMQVRSSSSEEIQQTRAKPS